MYIRKTRDEWEVQGRYTMGWEAVTSADTYREALGYLRDYRQNETETSFRLKLRRVKINA